MISKNENRYKLLMDGDWTLINLSEFTQKYSQVYSFLYSLEIPKEDPLKLDRVKYYITYQAFPWEGGYSAVNFYNYLYKNIPPKNRPKLIAIRYESPGWVELAMISYIASQIKDIIDSIAYSSEKVHHVYHEIYKGMQERKLLRKKVETEMTKLDNEQLKYVSESTKLLAKSMGFKNVKQINEYTKNPFVTLKILLSFYRRIRFLYNFHKNGKIQY